MTEFRGFPKIARYSRTIIITEKIDGTNASIYIGEDGEFLAGCRTRWLTEDKDNYGFYKWAMANKEELMKLGPGHHFGEWWGEGIQRRYGLKEKRFSLFNTARWEKETPPKCCSVVPVLMKYDFDQNVIESVLNDLRTLGSQAAPGFMKPEGIIIFHTASRTMFKKTLEDDDQPKGMKVEES